ncbi:MAG: hypothetical protein J5936_04460 [Acholeplasmatales bacterium]|nr:hypothetical protein [Acholeplasmatales bacterium]
MKIFVVEPISESFMNKLKSTFEITSDITTCDVAIIRNMELNKKVLDSAKNLKLIAVYGTGYNMIDLEYAKKLGIKVFNTPGLNKNAVSELTIGLMLDISRNISKSIGTKELGSNSLMGFEIRNKTVGFIGLGNISINTAKILHDGFNMNILGFNRHKKNISYIKEVELHYLLNNSDYIIIGLALNEETKNFINIDIFNKMDKKPYVINPSRGMLVNNDDLLYALKNNLIKGYASDVFYPEPIDDNNPLLNENVIILPHIGACTEEAHELVSNAIYDNFIRFINNEELNNLL